MSGKRVPNRWEAWFGRQIAYLLLSMVSTCVWYTFDDTLAGLVNWPELGHLSFWFVWPLTFWIRTMMPLGILEREVQK